ncbi:unnamed protein product, partial [Prorocentrum cordatum]
SLARRSTTGRPRCTAVTTTMRGAQLGQGRSAQWAGRATLRNRRVQGFRKSSAVVLKTTLKMTDGLGPGRARRSGGGREEEGKQPRRKGAERSAFCAPCDAQAGIPVSFFTQNMDQLAESSSAAWPRRRFHVPKQICPARRTLATGRRSRGFFGVQPCVAWAFSHIATWGVPE